MQNQWRLYPTRANAQPAFIVYAADESKNTYQAYGVQVVALDDSRLPVEIAEVTIFRNPSLVTTFGFPPQFPQ